MASTPPGWINPARRCKPCLRNVLYREDPNAQKGSEGDQGSLSIVRQKERFPQQGFCTYQLAQERCPGKRNSIILNSIILPEFPVPESGVIASRLSQVYP